MKEKFLLAAAMLIISGCSIFLGYNFYEYKKFGLAQLSAALSSASSSSAANSASSSVFAPNGSSSTAENSSGIIAASTAELLESASNCTATSTTQYKLVQNADECQLGKLSAQGWKIFQIGTVTTIFGKTADCQRNNYVNGLDWAVLYRDVRYETCQ